MVILTTKLKVLFETIFTNLKGQQHQHIFFERKNQILSNLKYISSMFYNKL
jgi:hypothetical protein